MKKLLSIFSIVALNKVVNDSSGMLFRGEILVSLRGGIADEAVSRQLSFARNDKKERFYNKCWCTERLSAPTFFKIKRA